MIGIDIEIISRFKSWNKEQFSRVFTEREIEYAKKFKNELEHFAGFYCVKEALVKALNNKSLKFNNIEVMHSVTGKPYINKNEYINSILSKYNLNNIEISISHTEDNATAVVIIN